MIKNKKQPIVYISPRRFPEPNRYCFTCSVCGDALQLRQYACNNCGQEIDWTDVVKAVLQ